MLVGYMRVSTDGRPSGAGPAARRLLAAGVDERHLFEDRASGSRDDRPAWPRRLLSSAPAIAWWSGSWTGSADRCPICSPR